MPTFLDGIIIGGTGGALAGLTVWLVHIAHTKAVEHAEKARVYTWLSQNTADNAGDQSASTRKIASWTNLTEERTRYVCSIHPRVFLVTDENKEQWSIHARELRSPYQERGFKTT